MNTNPPTPQHIEAEDQLKYTQMIAPLYLPCIELGLELCSYASKNRVGGSQGVKKVIIVVCSKFTTGISDLFSSLFI